MLEIPFYQKAPKLLCLKTPCIRYVDSLMKVACFFAVEYEINLKLAPIIEPKTIRTIVWEILFPSFHDEFEKLCKGEHVGMSQNIENLDVAVHVP